MSVNSKIKINMDSLKLRREWKRHKVNEGSNVFRFLPPFGEAANGYPYRKWQVIWGLVDTASNKMRPFASSITSEKRCPVTEYVAALQQKAEAIKGELKAKGASDEDVKTRLKGLNSVISNLRPKTVYAYNAASKAGEVGILELKSTAHKKLKTLMSEYVNEYNQDPTSLNADADDSGVWFDVLKTGKGFDTEYDVKKVQTKIKTESGFAFADDRSALAAGITANYEGQAYDLTTIYQVKTYDELRQILLANMGNILKESADALVAGFEPASATTGVVSVSSNGQTGGITAGTVTVGSNAESFKTNKVTLKLDDPEDTDDAPTAAATETDDLLAQADALLRDE